ncbi:unnamed protein product [Fusarium fujikuroi]|uniref:Zn(2)-C6 fungal-type domain-containing protein n=1 Tax=Fusarium fujikuroi TaxID=5127 RepID=A0A9Q9RKF0_FUSFU|nr:unnamed protein product [Fusarium fujikuroi]VTT78285.1 unnamed protein product [Fusarium fujikuroi]VZH88957.1 unnamed protein product [Fusarium fujikuroi]
MASESPTAEACPVRKRVSTACEACRATKIKCQPSEQPGKGVSSPRKNAYREQARERAEEGQNSRKYSVALGNQADR